MSTEDAIWTSLPVPAILLDPQDRIAGINPAAEGFMMSSLRTAGRGQAGGERAAGRGVRAGAGQ